MYKDERALERILVYCLGDLIGILARLGWAGLLVRYLFLKAG